MDGRSASSAALSCEGKSALLFPVAYLSVQVFQRCPGLMAPNQFHGRLGVGRLIELVHFPLTQVALGHGRPDRPRQGLGVGRRQAVVNGGILQLVRQSVRPLFVFNMVASRSTGKTRR